jgi:polyhydroxyalkanoate synthesis regulator phasin
MSEETKKVLEMVASGQITADDAEKLLEKLRGSGPAPAAPAASEEASGPTPKLRFLRIVVDKPDHDQVNVRVPLAILRTGIKLLAVLPPKVSERLAEKGIDLSALRDLQRDELVDQLKDLHVDVDSKNGEKVRIFCE